MSGGPLPQSPYPPPGGGSGTVTSVSGTSPINVATGTTTPVVSLGTVPVANGGTNATDAATARSNLSVPPIADVNSSGAVTKLQGSPVDGTAPTAGDFLIWDGTTWQNAPLTSFAGTSIQDVGTANSGGSGGNYARDNHTHKIGAGAITADLLPATITPTLVDSPTAMPANYKSRGADGATPQFTFDTLNTVTGANQYMRWKNGGTAKVEWWMQAGIVYLSDPTSAQALSFYGWTQLKPYTNNSALLGGPSNVWAQTWSQLYNTVKGANLASATTIAPLAGITHITGTTDIQTITPPTNFSAGTIILWPDGLWKLIAGGNILIPIGGGVAIVNKPMPITYDGTNWAPGY